MTLLSRKRFREQGSALIETAIVMPAFCMLVLATIFFGNVMLGLQKQRSVAWYVGLKGAASDEQLSQIFCQDVDGAFSVSGDSGPSTDDPYSGTKMKEFLDDQAIKKQYRRLEFVNGQWVAKDYEVGNYASNLMDQLGSIGSPERARYDAAAARAINRDVAGRLWLQRSSAKVSYTYAPDFLTMFLGNKDERLTKQQYLEMDMPETDVTLPTWESEFELMLRGTGERDGPRHIDAAGGAKVTGEQLFRDMLSFLSDSGFTVSDDATSKVRLFEDATKISEYWTPGGPD